MLHTIGAWLLYLLMATPGWLVVSIVAMASLRPAAKPRMREWLLLGVPCAMLLATSAVGAWILASGPVTLSRAAASIALGSSPLWVIYGLLTLKRLLETARRNKPTGHEPKRTEAAESKRTTDNDRQ